MDLGNLLKESESVGFRKEELEAVLQKWQKETGLKLSKDKRLKVSTLVREAYARCINGLYGDDLKLLKKMTGTEPPEDLVQEKYDRFARNFRVYYLLELKKITGIEPNLSREAVREGYSKLFREGAHWRNINGWVKILKDIQEATGIKPLKESIQEAYSSLIVHRGFKEVKELREATGIEPLEEVVQEGYITLIKGQLTFLKANFEYLSKLQEVTGINPSEATMQKVYATCIEWGRINELRELQKATGIKPSKKIYRTLPDSL